MVRVLGSARRPCDGLTRRELLQAGGLGLFGLSAADLGGLQQAQGAAATSAEAEQIFARVVPGERPDAINLLREGAYQLKQNRVDAALDSFRKAGRILRNPSITGGARPEYILPWLDALHTAGEQSPADRELYARAEDEAHNARRGLWADVDPIEPSAFRKEQKREREEAK